MKSGSISVLNATNAAIALAVVDTTAPVMRLGSIVDAAINADPAVVNLFLIDPQAGKVCVLLDANRVAVQAAINGAAGMADDELFTATGTTKAKSWTASGATVTAGSLAEGSFPALENPLMLGELPKVVLASAISLVEDALVNPISAEDDSNVVPCLILVSQTAGTMWVGTFDTNAHAATAYGLGIAASTKQAEFLCTPPAPTGGAAKEFFA